MSSITEKRTEWEKRYNQVVASGGLHIIGSERHESRRIDNQLRGRSGRQGDPGSSQFYLSLEDELMRIFGGDRVKGLMQQLGMQQDESIEHSWVTRAIQNAQRKVEAHHFDMRKGLLEFDDVMNEQRKIIYQQRQEILVVDKLSETIQPFWEEVLQKVVSGYVPASKLKESWNISDLIKKLDTDFGLSLPIERWLQSKQDAKALPKKVINFALQNYQSKKEQLGVDKVDQLEKTIMLQVIDDLWKEHLAIMEHLRQGIHLRGFAQKNPKQEYKREAFELFEQLLERLKYQVVSILSRLEMRALSEPPRVSDALQLETGYQMIGRNQACPCGSRKKFKHCHGQLN
jgi:preprotein translocase subunit SecA